VARAKFTNPTMAVTKARSEPWPIESMKGERILVECGRSRSISDGRGHFHLKSDELLDLRVVRTKGFNTKLSQSILWALLSIL
jgi:hypothetical protein